MRRVFVKSYNPKPEAEVEVTASKEALKLTIKDANFENVDDEKLEITQITTVTDNTNHKN